MNDATALERRYRRMLIWFPVEHRQIYEEEMIGVLLASAPDGQRRPSLGDVTNLAGAGLRTRLGRTFRLDRLDPNWRDAFAAYSVAAPVLLLLYTSAQLYISLKYRPFFFRRGHAQQLDLGHNAYFLTEVALIVILAALVITPVLIRREQRTAVAIAVAVPTLVAAVAAIEVIANAAVDDLTLGLMIFFVLEAIAVAISRDPGRGWRLLGWKSLVVLIVIGVLAAIDTLSSADWIRNSRIQLAVLAVAFALVLIFAPKAIKGMVALMAIPGYAIIAFVPIDSQLYIFDRNGPDYLTLLYLPTLVITVLVILAIWQASRQAAITQAADPA